MSITRDFGMLVFECNGPDCVESLETDTEDWDEAKDLFDDEEWQARRVANQWFHYCKACKEGF